MNDNNCEFANYLKQQISVRIIGDNWLGVWDETNCISKCQGAFV
jgi:hypothetical protein